MLLRPNGNECCDEEEVIYPLQVDLKPGQLKWLRDQKQNELGSLFLLDKPARGFGIVFCEGKELLDVNSKVVYCHA